MRSAAAMAAWRMLYLSLEVLDGAEEALGVLDEGDQDAERDGVAENAAEARCARLNGAMQSVGEPVNVSV